MLTSILCDMHGEFVRWLDGVKPGNIIKAVYNLDTMMTPSTQSVTTINDISYIPAYFIPVCVLDEDEEYCNYGLILISCGDQTYSRIGIMKYDWYTEDYTKDEWELAQEAKNAFKYKLAKASEQTIKLL
jgi:hypothetical protein